MDGKAKFIFPVLMAGVMAFLMTALVTYLNLGFPRDFLSRWMIAFLIAWPCATAAAFIAIPLARRATARIIALIDGQRPE
jgi:predicted PurR-regulated permease PerM